VNILFADQFSEPGGAQLCLMDLMPAILRRGWRPHMILPGNGRLVEWSRQWKVPVYPLPLRALSNGRKGLRDLGYFGVDTLRTAAELREVVQQHRIDVLYVNGPRVLPAVVGLECPLIFHAHSIVSGSWVRHMASWVVRTSRAQVIAVSEYAGRPYSSIPGIRVIYNGVPDYGPRRVFSDGRLRVGMAGRIAPEKGQLDFVKAARRIGGERLSFRICGDSLFSAGDYARRVRNEAAGSPVEFAGWRDDTAGMFADLDILVVPSSSDEASPRVVIEALSAGVPVVAYRSGGIPELIEDGRTGIFTDSPDWESLANALVRLGSNLHQMNAISAAGRREWEVRFTLKRYQDEICRFIENITSRSDRRSKALKADERLPDSNRRASPDQPLPVESSVAADKQLREAGRERQAS
jgi:glycosyltransferase involved in cell wall biosynthesis